VRKEIINPLLPPSSLPFSSPSTTSTLSCPSSALEEDKRGSSSSCCWSLLLGEDAEREEVEGPQLLHAPPFRALFGTNRHESPAMPIGEGGL